MFIVEQKDDGKHGAFIAKEGSIQAGEMTYTWAGEKMFIIDHTGVEEGFNGRGVGRTMLDQAVKLAREKQFKILPLCPYPKSVFVKDESIRDVLNG